MLPHLHPFRVRNPICERETDDDAETKDDGTVLAEHQEHPETEDVNDMARPHRKLRPSAEDVAVIGGRDCLILVHNTRRVELHAIRRSALAAVL